MDAPVEDSLYSAKYYAQQASDIVAGGVSQATENILGGAKIATAADMTTGTDDTKIVTPLKANNFVSGKLADYVTNSALATNLETKADVSALSGYATTSALTDGLATKVNSSDLSPVATSGSYNDLTDVPEDSIVQTSSDLTNGTIVLNRNISIYRHTATAAITFSFDTSGLGLTNGETATFELKVTMAAVQTLTFPATVKWLDGEAPDISSAGIYYFVFRTDDNGTTWYGNSQGRWDV